jgi:hypothetical protein
MAFETLGALIVVDAIARALLMALRLVFVNRPATPQPAWHRLAYSPEARGDTRGTIVLPFREKPEYGLLNFPPDDDGGPEEPPAASHAAVYVTPGNWQPLYPPPPAPRYRVRDGRRRGEGM